MQNQELARLEYLEYNGHSIESPVLSNKHRMLAIKPICEVLDLRYRQQFDAVRNHKYFGQLCYMYSMVASDGKRREMLCLPEMEIGYWIHGISDRRRTPTQIALKYSFLIWYKGRIKQSYIPSEALQYKEQLKIEEKNESHKLALRATVERTLRLNEEHRLEEGLAPDALLLHRRNHLIRRISENRLKLKRQANHTKAPLWALKLSEAEKEIEQVEVELKKRFMESKQAAPPS